MSKGKATAKGSLENRGRWSTLPEKAEQEECGRAANVSVIGRGAIDGESRTIG